MGRERGRRMGTGCGAAAKRGVRQPDSPCVRACGLGLIRAFRASGVCGLLAAAGACGPASEEGAAARPGSRPVSALSEKRLRAEVREFVTAPCIDFVVRLGMGEWGMERDHPFLELSLAKLEAGGTAGAMEASIAGSLQHGDFSDREDREILYAGILALCASEGYGGVGAELWGEMECWGGRGFFLRRDFRDVPGMPEEGARPCPGP